MTEKYEFNNTKMMNDLLEVSLFGDLNEINIIYNLLDLWANSPPDFKIPKTLFDRKGYICKQLKIIGETIQQLESKFNTHDRFKLQLEIILQTEEFLSHRATPSYINSNLEKIKLLISQAQLVVYEINLRKTIPRSIKDYENKINLRHGPIESQLIRKQKADQKNLQVKEMIDNLYRDGKGWRWSNARIAKHFIAQGISYKESYLKTIINRYTPEIKEKYPQTD